MEPNILIAALVVGVLIFTIYMGLDAFFNRRRTLQDLKNRLAADGSTIAMDTGGELFGLEKEKTENAVMFENILRMFGINVDAAIKKLELPFAHAGILSADGPIYYLFCQRIVSVFFVITGFLFISTDADGLDELLNIIVGVIIAGLGVFGPYLYITNKTQHRQKILLRSFPDALDLMLVCVESGLALDAALGRVCKELGRAHPEITKELNRTRLELALLNDRTRALMNLAERTNIIAFRSLVAALIQTEKFGTSLTDTLRVLSDDYRNTRLMIAENKAGRLPTLLTIPLIFLLMPAFILIILAPSFIRVAQQGGLFGNQ